MRDVPRRLHQHLYGSDGAASVVWTDVRDFDADLDGFLQFISFGRLE
jgi:hypothetical protein